MNIRRIAAVWAAKAAGFICKKMGRQGVTWAGKIALKIYPPVLRELASEVRRDIFVVCGTNGKRLPTICFAQLWKQRARK